MLKRVMSLLLTMVTVLVPVACAQAASETDGAAVDALQEEAGKTLVAYFSWSGNTEEIAAHIAEQTGADLLEIQPETPYPTDYNECGDVALAERDNNERPAIANLPESLDEYETILIGYPIWLAYHKLIQCTQLA